MIAHSTPRSHCTETASVNRCASGNAKLPTTDSTCLTVLMPACKQVCGWMHSRLFVIAGIVFLMTFSGVAGSRWLQDKEATAIVSRLTDLQRAEVKQNFAYFLSLPAETQQALLDLNAVVEENPTTLQPTLIAYGHWLETLSPFERQLIQSETESSAKLLLVRAELEKQSDEKLQSPLSRMKQKGPHFHESELKQLSSILASDLTPEQRTSLNGLSEGKSMVRTITMYIDSKATSVSQFRDTMRSSDNLQQFINVVRNNELKQHLAETPASQKLTEFGKALIRGVVIVLFQEKYAATNVSKETLTRMFSDMDSSRKNQFFEMSPELQVYQLRMMYLMENSKREEHPFIDPDITKIAQAFDVELRSFLGDGGRFSRPGGGPPRGPGGGGPGGGGPGGPGDRDRDNRGGGGGFFNNNDSDPNRPPRGPGGPPPSGNRERPPEQDRPQ